MTVSSCNASNGNCTLERKQLKTNCSILLFQWIMNHTDIWLFLSSVFPLLSLLSCHSTFHSHLVDIPDCSSPSSSLLDCLSSTSPALSLQSSDSVEGPGCSWCPSASSVPSPVAWRGRVPDGAQVQARPGAEAEDPAAGTISATTPGWPLPHWGLPWGDIWGKKQKQNTNKQQSRRCHFYMQTHRHYTVTTYKPNALENSHLHLCSHIMNHHLKLAQPQKCTYL